MKYIIVSFINSPFSKEKETCLIEFRDVKYADWAGSVDLINARIIKRKNPDTVIILNDDYCWKYKKSNNNWHGFNGFSEGFYKANVIDDKATAELLFELEE